MPTMRLRRGGSDAAEPWSAVRDLHGQIGGVDLAFVLLFCSPSYDLAELAAAIRHYFGEARVFGCTTAGEITPFGYISGGISGVGFPKGEFEFAATLFEGLRRFEIAGILDQTRALMAAFDLARAETDDGRPAKSFGLVLVDG